MKALALAIVAFLSLGPLAGAGAPNVPDKPLAIVLHCTIFNDTRDMNGSDIEQIVIIGGEVRVDYVQFVAVKVFLTASADMGWNATVTPAEMTFTASSVQGFSANLTVPGGTYNRSAVMTVRANATLLGAPADTASDSITINVKGPSSTPVVPPIKKPGGKPMLTPLNMPLVALVVSLAAIGGAILTLQLWKNRREKRAGKGKKPAREGARAAGAKRRRPARARLEEPEDAQQDESGEQEASEEEAADSEYSDEQQEESEQPEETGPSEDAEEQPEEEVAEAIEVPPEPRKRTKYRRREE